ncbi:response regulator transcription factor [Streptomyces sp. NPDC004134]|uniref:response regulator transcription factor n=1 Tax=Streptomyces sp. NPDC004134 TaxID=3364691 RepID=UPI0036CA62FD
MSTPQDRSRPLVPGRHRVLVVEDDPGIRTLLTSALTAYGYRVATADSGSAALFEAGAFTPDLIVLDVMLPDLDGFAVTRQLRLAGIHTPVLFLTARTEPEDRVSGLRAGGDDYVTKPFHLQEVLLRVHAILRRTAGRPRAEQPSRLRYADVELDLRTHEVSRSGEPVPLSPTEFRLLACLLARSTRVVSKADILQEVWHHDFAGDTRIVDTYIKYLRRKIDRTGRPLIHTIRGVGYTLRLPHRERGGREGHPPA